MYEFESYVISYRTKTQMHKAETNHLFESYVISYRTKTSINQFYLTIAFESYVISYRTKTWNIMKPLRQMV